ncbi:MAG: DUF3524 domain-containing protein, partial [Candidatus Brocadiae bacterium]|nr:DUF3524 domain-containing protein [Candidatus Brocadiia bacterium]
MLRIVALEPYYGGSHKAFLDGYRDHSRHCVELLTMPARKWKWRMRAAALTMGQMLKERQGQPDAILVSDYLDLAALVGMHPDLLRGVPRAAYFHENQLTYPVPAEDERDYQFGFTNITTCLAADRVLFNSRYHLESFIEGAELFLDRAPDYAPGWVPASIRERSEVVPVGVDLEAIDRNRSRSAGRQGPLTILWNHRWEYDKNPEEFFEVLFALQDEGVKFRVLVAGERFRESPAIFAEAKKRLADRIDHFGYVTERREYLRLLRRGDIVISTA